MFRLTERRASVMNNQCVSLLGIGRTRFLHHSWKVGVKMNQTQIFFMLIQKQN